MYAWITKLKSSYTVEKRSAIKMNKPLEAEIARMTVKSIILTETHKIIHVVDYMLVWL